MEATEEEFELAEKRLEAWDENIGIANFRLGELTKKDMLEHIKSRDEVGEQLTQIQLNYLKKLKKRK